MGLPVFSWSDLHGTSDAVSLVQSIPMVGCHTCSDRIPHVDDQGASPTPVSNGLTMRFQICYFHGSPALGPGHALVGRNSPWFLGRFEMTRYPIVFTYRELIPSLHGLRRAGCCPSLFARFMTTMDESDCFLFAPDMGYGFLLSHEAPAFTGVRQALPGPDTDVRTCMGSLTPRSPAVPHLGGPAGVAFDRDYSLGTLDERQGAFDAQGGLPIRTATDASPTPSRCAHDGSRRNVDGWSFRSSGKLCTEGGVAYLVPVGNRALA